MNFTDVVAILIIVLIVGAATFYLVRAKKKGKKCIGCPYCDSCSKRDCNDKDK